MIKKLLLAFVLLIAIKSYSQSTYSARIIDEKGNPLVGATIRFKDKSIGTISDENGSFNISTKNKNQVVEITYLGYETKFVPVSDLTNNAIVIIRKYESLCEVVVVTTIHCRKSCKRYLCGSTTIVTGDVNKLNKTTKTTDIPQPNNTTIYPNPIINQFTYSMDASTEEDIHFEIFNINGIAVKQFNFRTIKGRNNFMMDIHELAKGSYFIKSFTNSNKKTQPQKLIKLA